MLVTYIAKVWEPATFSNRSLDEALDDIRSEKYTRIIERIRSIDRETNEIEYRSIKNGLPCFSFNGTFKNVVSNKSFDESSGLFHFDIDKLENAEADKAVISQIPGVVFAFVSPGGKGIKGAVKVDPSKIKNDADFKKAFTFFAAYFAGYGYSLDKSCKDVRRVCYVSHDPLMFYTSDAKVIDFDAKAPSAPDVEGACIDRVISIMKGATNGERHNCRIKAARLAGGFIAGGLVSESKMTDILRQLSDSFADNGNTSKSELKTLEDGIKYGMLSPITRDNYKRSLQSPVGQVRSVGAVIEIKPQWLMLIRWPIMQRHHNI